MCYFGNIRLAYSDIDCNSSESIKESHCHPFGMPMPMLNTDGGYRYAYQGQEKDDETGKEAFELRLWDSRIGRWLTTDPAGQYASPYLGMGNNPISRVDPDGGSDCPDPPCNKNVVQLDEVVVTGTPLPLVFTSGVQQHNLENSFVTLA